MGKGTVAQCAYSVLAYTAKKIKPLFDALEIDENRPLKILCSGGGAKNRVWTSLIEKELNVTLNVIDKSPLDGVACMLKNNLNER